MSFTFIDLFAGIGGFHSSLEKLGGKAVFASEIDEAAKEVYKLNWEKSTLSEIAGDIKPLTEGEEVLVPLHEVLTGGFPCQPFSKSGKQQGVNEARGTLFYNILRIIEAKKPELVLLENVLNLVGPKHINDYHKMIRLLRDLGYVVSNEPTIISPHEIPEELGGTPQHRQRVFIGAIKMTTNDSLNFKNIGPLLKKNPFPEVKEWDIKAFLKNSLKASDSDSTSLNELSPTRLKSLDIWNDFLHTFKKNNINKNLPGFPLWTEYWKENISDENLELLPKWKKDIIVENHNFYLTNMSWIQSWQTSDFNALKASFKKFEWQAGNEIDLFECLIQFRPSGIRVKKANYVPAFVALTQTPVLGWLKRTLTINEAKILQGFPNDFNFGMQKESLSFKQIGNAVHPGVAGVVFQALVKRAIKIGQTWANSLDTSRFNFSEITINDEETLF